MARNGKTEPRNAPSASPREGPHARPNALERFSTLASAGAGSSWAFALAVLVIVVWGATGPLFGFSDTWQLVINTGTTIVTFLMVFLIQRSQNKDSRALHLKVNEIVAALEGASNRLIDAEGLTEAELETLHKHYAELSALTAREASLTKSHSVEEAGRRSAAKLGGRGKPGPR
jgi:low affinity Fe/Cu permease